MYQQHLSDAVQLLEQAETTLYEGMLNLMMTGELSDWNAFSPENELISLDDSLFEASEDPNIQILLKLLRQIAAANQNLQKNR